MRILYFDTVEAVKLRMNEFLDDTFKATQSPVQVAMMEGQLSVAVISKQDLETYICKKLNCKEECNES